MMTERAARAYLRICLEFCVSPRKEKKSIIPFENFAFRFDLTFSTKTYYFGVIWCEKPVFPLALLKISGKTGSKKKKI